LTALLIGEFLHEFSILWIVAVDVAYNIWLFADGIKKDWEGALCSIPSRWTHIGTAYRTSV